MAKVITMGEIMLRLSTPNNEKFIQADEFDICYGGGEANVAVSLANYGHDAEFVTAVPDNEIGECAVAALRKYGVQTNHIAKCGERLGIYFLETGSSMRPSKVVYDRAHSSISTATEADFDFDAIFEGADWFHFTGITPAITPSLVEICEDACKAAKARGVKISCDLNYRGKLWTRAQAREAKIAVVRGVLVAVFDDGAQGESTGDAVFKTGEENGQIRFLARRGQGALTGFAAVHESVQFLQIDGLSGGETVNIDADGFTVGLAEDRHFQQFSELRGHGSHLLNAGIPPRNRDRIWIRPPPPEW